MPYKKTKLSTLTKGNSIFFNGKRLFPCRLLNWNTDRVKFSGHANFSILTDSVSHFSNALESFGLLFCRLFFFNLCLLILFSFKCSKVESCSAKIFVTQLGLFCHQLFKFLILTERRKFKCNFENEEKDTTGKLRLYPTKLFVDCTSVEMSD